MRILTLLVTGTLLLAACAAGCFFFLTQHPWVDFSALNNYKPGKPSIVYDEQGIEWARFQLDRRDPVKLQDIPRQVIQAFLAAEDRNFYAHAGISWKGIIRSFLVNIYRGRKAQGASTITQQLVKLLFFDNSKNFTRKLKEQLLACIVEQQFTKDQILEIYLNHIYFGCGIYGIQAAAQRFWCKKVEDLTLEEGATLAGIIRLPGKYCPLEQPENARKRRNVILQCMHNAHYIDKVTCEKLIQTPLTLHSAETTEYAPHAREMVRIFMEELVGKHMLYTGGLTIQTTLNKAIQEQASITFSAHVALLRAEVIAQAEGALMCIDTASAGVKALVGGYEYKSSQFNRALQARRQMGSVFKPLVFAAALEQGAQFTDVRIDEPISYTMHGTLWEPRNSNRRFDGPMTLAHALVRSNNMIPIQLLIEMGTDKVIDYAERCEIAGPLYPYPSLALGCIDSTPFEVAGMFNIFVNNGVYVRPHLITWVKDQLGNKIYKHTPNTRSVMSSQISSQITKALLAARPHWQRMGHTNWPNCELIGKTGTTNDARTCWFAGSTPSYTTIVYIGRDDNQPMGKHVFAVRTAMPLWLDFNSRIPQPKKTFALDPRLTEIIVHQKTGKKLWNKQEPQAIALLTS